MSIFSATTFYNIQPVAVGPAFLVRTDSSSSFVQLAVPGTNFGTFGMTNFQSDISATIRGSGVNSTLIVTSSGASNVCIISSSVVNSGSYDFATDGGYTTSVFQEDGGSIGAVTSSFGAFNSGSAAQLPSPATNGDFVIETWVYLQERFASPGAPFHKSIIRDTASSFSCDISFPSNQPNQPGCRLRMIRGGSQTFSGNISWNLNAWYHIAFAWTASTGNITAYWHGTRVINAVNASVNATGLNYRILGGDLGVNDGAKGSIQDYRVTIGSNRGYTGTTMTVPNSIVIKG
jgi:hypothetical protein